MLDYFTFRQLTREISIEITGQWLRRIFQPHPQELLLHFAKEKNILISLEAQSAHVRLEKERPGQRLSSPFLLLARKYLEGKKILSCEMISGQKIMILSVHDAFLIVELPGIRNKLFLLDAEKNVLATLPRQTGLAKEKYSPPPTPYPHLGLASVPEINAAWPALYSGENKEWWGLSKTTWETLRTYPEDKALEIFLEMRDRGTVPIRGLSPLNTRSFLETFSDFYASRQEAVSRETRQKQFISLISGALEKKQKKEKLQNEALEKARNGEINKQFGDFILTSLSEIKPGQEKLLYPETGEFISLDPKIKPAKNSEKYYSRYKKAKQTVTALTHELETLAKEIHELNELETWAHLCENDSHFEWLRQQLERFNLHLPEQVKKKIGIPEHRCLKIKGPHGAFFLVGRNVVENMEVLRLAKKDDLWFHARGIPGGHVAIREGEKKVSDEMILQAAKMAAFYSQGRNWDKVPVDYTPRKEVRPIPGAQAQVTYRNHKTILVKPNK